MLQIVTMAGVYALACAMAEVRSYSVGQHLGSAIVVTFGAGALTHLLPGMPDLASLQLACPRCAASAQWVGNAHVAGGRKVRPCEERSGVPTRCTTPPVHCLPRRMSDATAASARASRRNSQILIGSGEAILADSTSGMGAIARGTHASSPGTLPRAMARVPLQN